MIIYNHVVNQCEDQKLILSQIFNTPIYKPNYSCSEFQDFEVTWGRKSHTEVIPRSYRGHIQLMSLEKEGHGWGPMLGLGPATWVDLRSFEVNNENNYTVDFCEGLNSSLS